MTIFHPVYALPSSLQAHLMLIISTNMSLFLVSIFSRNSAATKNLSVPQRKLF
jgi:hypothetical protein